MEIFEARILPRQSKGRAGCIGVQKKPSRELRLMAMLIPIPILTMPATARNSRTLECGLLIGFNSGMELRTQVGQTLTSTELIFPSMSTV